jgi:hypothetical protein
MPYRPKSPKVMPGKSQAASGAERVPSAPRKAAAGSAPRSLSDIIGPNQLRQADLMLRRIERRNEALSANADQLLRRVS